MHLNLSDELFSPALGPNSKLLTDKKILSQAWKKTNIFIRENNWYFDSLELDLYSYDIENKLEILSSNTLIKMQKIKVIPVPKNSTWYFQENGEKEFDSWQSLNNDEDKLELRGISLVPIDNQVKLTSILICLAEAIETIQGTLKTELNEILKGDFYNYGNRLQCIWTYENESEKANFQTGSSMLYEKYFQNYKYFLKRPLEVAKYYTECLSSNNKIYIVNLDISKFYDNIDIGLLLEFIKNHLTNYYKENNLFSTDEISEFINQIKPHFDFEYDNSFVSQNIIEKISGLPQGLASSGFFSNIYLINFDKEIGRLKNVPIHLKKDKEKYTLINKADSKGLIIRDYCRYVDDIRVVIEINETLKFGEVKDYFLEVISHILSESINKKTNSNQKLSFNKKKYELIDYQHYYKKPMSQLLNSYRAIASGTPTLEDVTNNLDSLKNLFINSMNIKNERTSNKLALSRINTEQWDVKDSTVKKFIATELKKNILIKSKATPFSPVANKDLNSEHIRLKLERQNISKILLEAWTRDPSLIYLLKISFEISPSSKNLKSLIETLDIKLFPNDLNETRQKREQQVTFYTIGQLFYLGFNIIFEERNRQDNINNKNYGCFLEILVSFGEKLISYNKEKNLKLPFYLTQNLILFLVTMDKGNFELVLSKKENELLKNYILFQKLHTQPFEQIMEYSASESLAVALIGNQIFSNDRSFSNWFIKLINSLNNTEEKKKLINKLFQENNTLFRNVFANNCGLELQDYSNLLAPYKNYLNVYKTTNLNLIDNKEISLLKVILSNENPFKQENALLLLARQLFNKSDLLRDLSILNIDVECKDWSTIQNPNTYSDDFLKVNINKHTFVNDELKIRPFWLANEFSMTNKHLNHKNSLEYYQSIYNIGVILRSCILGDYHYTSTRSLLSESNNKFFGFKNTYFSRTFGLDNSIRQLANRSQPITPWFGEFLFYCLRWPYAHFTIEMEVKYKDIPKLINNRISYQKRIFGDLTGIPMYVYPVELSEQNTSNKIKVGIVQTVLPKSNDFDTKNPLYWSEESRVLQRNHLINICNLIERHLSAYSTSTHLEQHIDLLVFPEVSIHEDDIDILRRLVSKIKTNIFAGLMFMKNPTNNKEVINQAIWMIRNNKNDKEEIIELFQGKGNLTKNEKAMGIVSYRPYQLIMEFNNSNNQTWKVSGSICYDSTDLKLAADLRDITDAFVIAAYNKDVQTFDNMASSLSYHMYQPIILANIGIYGGSTIQAPLAGHDKLIAHLHGANQIGIGIFEIDMNEFKSLEKEPPRLKTKTPPAGYIGRNIE